MIAFIHHVPAEGAASRLTRVLRWASDHGIDGVVLAVGAEIAGAVAALADEADPGVPARSSPRILAVVDAPAASDLGGALVDARAWLTEGAVVVLDASAPLGFDLRALLAEHHQSPAIITIALVPAECAEPGAMRADVDRSGRLLGLCSEHAAQDDQPAVDGCLVVETGLLSGLAGQPRPLHVWRDLVPYVLGRGGVVGGYRVNPVPATA